MIKTIKFAPLALIIALNVLVVAVTFSPAKSESAVTCGSMDWGFQYHYNHPACNPGSIACTDPMPEYSTCTYHMWVGIPTLQIPPPEH